MRHAPAEQAPIAKFVYYKSTQILKERTGHVRRLQKLCFATTFYSGYQFTIGTEFLSGVEKDPIARSF